MLRFNAILPYVASRNADNSHSITRPTFPGQSVAITFGDAGTADETIIFDSLTWTVKASGASGREFNIGGSAALSAASFQAAFAAHADGLLYTATVNSATVTLVKVALTAISGVTGTFNTTAAYAPRVIPPASTAGVALYIDTAQATTKMKMWAAVRAIMRALRRDSAKATSPADLPSGTTLE